MRWWVFLFCLLAFPLGAAAQSGAPLIVYRDGDLFAVQPDGTSEALTERPASRRQAQPIGDRDVYVSPDGRYIAYRDVPEFVAEQWNNNELGNMGELPTDLFLIDRETGDETRIAVHPDENRWYYRAGGRRAAAWAPDGSAFAYSESFSEGDAFRTRVLVYDVASGETTVLLEDGGAPIQWTDDGLMVGTRVYDADLALIAQGWLHDSLHVSHAVRVDGRDLLAVSERIIGGNEEGVVGLFDPLTGEYFTAPGYLSIVSATAAPSVALVNYTNDTRPDGIYAPDGSLLLQEDGEPPYIVGVVAAPDGTSFAHAEAGDRRRGTVVYDDAGAELAVVEGTVVAWGADRWTVFNPAGDTSLTPTRQFETPEACGPLREVALEAGDTGVVVDETANRLRSAPRLDAEIIGTIPVGATFTTLQGISVCSGGLRWRAVQYDDLQGWTAEGTDGTVFIGRAEGG